MWNYDEGASTTSSSALDGQTIYVPSHGLTALAVSARRRRSCPFAGGRPTSRRACRARFTSTVASTASRGGRFSWRPMPRRANSPGGLRLKGTFYASPIAADGRLYVVNDDGLGQIITLDAKAGHDLVRARFQRERDGHAGPERRGVVHPQRPALVEDRNKRQLAKTQGPLTTTFSRWRLRSSGSSSSVPLVLTRRGDMMATTRAGWQ